MTPKSEFGSRVKFFFWKFSLEMIEFILIRNPNEILRVKLSKLGFHFQNFIPYKKQPETRMWSSDLGFVFYRKGGVLLFNRYLACAGGLFEILVIIGYLNFTQIL